MSDAVYMGGKTRALFDRKLNISKFYNFCSRACSIKLIGQKGEAEAFNPSFFN